MSGPSSSTKIRVLIVDDIPETRENVKKLLYFEQDVEIVGMGANGREGVELALKLQPDIVLMDINMPEMDGIAASEAISRQVPVAQVVMMSVQGESDYLRRSMLAGAREFLIKPFSGDELINSIHRVYQFSAATRRAMPVQPSAAATPAAPPAPPPRAGKVIAVLGTKGGSGSSTLAVNLAVALREETRARVALIDGSFEFGDIGVLLNLPSSRTISEVTGENTDIDEELLDGLMPAHSSGVKILLAPARPELAGLIKVDHLKQILDILTKSYAYTVVDLWKSFQEATICFLDSADLIILVAMTDIPSIKNAKLFFELTEQLGYRADKIFFVLNKEDGRSGISAKDIEASIKHPVGAMVPKDERTTLLAANRGLPFVTSQKNVPIAQAILAITRSILQKTAPDKVAVAPPAVSSPAPAPAPPKRGFFSRK
ncbi:MAG: response regulator [Chloroflexi bacterium]|nr:response regulator [Chloroflexota bacterium]